MSNLKFELNLKGLNELMKSEEMQGLLQSAGDAVAAAAGDDYGVRVHTASFVAIANVYPTSKASAKENFEKNALLKALGSAGIPMTK